METDEMGGQDAGGDVPRAAVIIYSPPERPGWECALALAWLAGSLGLWVPFFTHWRLGPGHFAFNIAIGFGVALLGGAAVAVWTLVCRRAAGGTRRAGAVAVALLACAAAAFALAGTGHLPFAPGMWAGGTLVLAAGCAAVCAGSRKGATGRLSALPGDAVGRFFRPSYPWNVWFWILLLALFVARDAYYLATNITADPASKWGIFAARFGTQLMSVAALAVAVRLTRSILPRKAAWGSDFAVSLVVGFTLADLLLIEMWEQPVVHLLNGLTSSGRFDLGQELEASGTGIGPLLALALLALFALGCFALYGSLALLSRRTGFRPSSAALALVALLGCGLAVGEQAVSKSWKPVEVWQQEVATFPFQVGPLRPRVGIATFAVEFADPHRNADTDGLVDAMGQEPPGAALRTRPDIYLFMVESFRRDAITAENAPFLTRFSQSECQQFGSTYAASNCTPLSWFGALHSRVPVFWSGALEERDAGGDLPGAYPLRLLKAAGYQLQVRAINDLGYKEMAALQFGTGQHLADVYKDDFGRNDGFGFGEREQVLFEDLKREVLALPRGGTFHFVALDSPHYNYYWPRSFEPPHTNYEEDIFFGINPSPEQLTNVKNRYHNAVAWVDHSIEGFVRFLQSQDRYAESIIIVTGDHGEEFQEHGSWFHCSALVREQTEVPIMIKWPASSGTAPRRELVSHLDLMPSLLDALGVAEKFRAPLVGRALWKEEAGQAVVTSGWAGRSGVAMTFLAPDLKAGFTWPGPWEQRVPVEANLKQFSTLSDESIDVGTKKAGDLLREKFAGAIARFFVRFEEI